MVRFAKKRFSRHSWLNCDVFYVKLFNRGINIVRYRRLRTGTIIHNVDLFCNNGTFNQMSVFNGKPLNTDIWLKVARQQILWCYMLCLYKMCSEKKKNVNGVKALIKKVGSTGIIERLLGSGYWVLITDQHPLQLQIVLDNTVDWRQEKCYCMSRTLPMWVCGFPSWLSVRPSTFSMSPWENIYLQR